MLLFIIGDSSLIATGILFVITHALLSAVMFYVVDCVYRRFGSRSIVEVHGILTPCPNFGIYIVIMQLCFVGLPGTVKFLVEFNLLSSIILSFPFTVLIILIINIFAVVGFSKIWFNLIFGIKLNHTAPLIDLSNKEISILIPLAVLQLFFVYFYYFISF